MLDRYTSNTVALVMSCPFFKSYDVNHQLNSSATSRSVIGVSFVHMFPSVKLRGNRFRRKVTKNTTTVPVDYWKLYFQ